MMTRVNSCPFCSAKITTRDYSSYIDPPEWYDECENCSKYKLSYFYYTGFSFQLGEWHLEDVTDEETILKFNNSINHIVKRRAITKCNYSE